MNLGGFDKFKKSNWFEQNLLGLPSKDVTFYDKDGTPIAYTEDLNNVYDFMGNPVGYIDEESFYSYSGKHLGWIICGWVVDNAGYAVFYTEYSTNGPFKPFKGFKKFIPYSGFKNFKPFKPMQMAGWSSLSKDDFFNQ
jgi:hypothetical protein